MNLLRSFGGMLCPVSWGLALAVLSLGCASSQGWSGLDGYDPAKISDSSRTLSVAIVYVAGASPEAADYLDSLRRGKCHFVYGPEGRKASAPHREDAVQAAVLGSMVAAFSFWESFQGTLAYTTNNSKLRDRVVEQYSSEMSAFYDAVLAESQRKIDEQASSTTPGSGAVRRAIARGPDPRQSAEMQKIVHESVVSRLSGIKPIFVPTVLVRQSGPLSLRYPDWAAEGNLETISDVIVETALYFDECNAGEGGLIGRVGAFEWLYRISMPKNTGRASSIRLVTRDTVAVSWKGADTLNHVVEGIFRNPPMLRPEEEWALVTEMPRDENWSDRMGQAMSMLNADVGARDVRFNDATISRDALIIARDETGEIRVDGTDELPDVNLVGGGGYPLRVLTTKALALRQAESDRRVSRYANGLGVQADRARSGSLPEDELRFLEVARATEIQSIYDSISKPALREWYASEFGRSVRRGVAGEVAAMNRLAAQRQSVAMAQSLAYMQGMQAMQSSPGSMQGYMTVAQATQVAQQAHAEISAASREVQRNIQQAGALQAEYSLEWAGIAHRISADSPAEVRRELRSLYQELFGARASR